MPDLLPLILFCLMGFGVCLLFWFLIRRRPDPAVEALSIERFLGQQLSGLQDRLHHHSQSQNEQLQGVQDKLSSNLQQTLAATQEMLARRLFDLNASTETRLQTMSAHMHKTLDDGFVKNGGTLEQITTRLATIDEAQRKIAELSQGVLKLQDILGDKRARGAFGEMQLSMILEDALPPSAISLQHVLTNGTRVDCLLRIPSPSGPLGIDAKFPLENYQRSVDPSLSEHERNQASSLFKQDLKRHIIAIRDKYIVPPETAHGAIMFLPSEAIFAQLHSHHQDIIKFSHESQVWIASPSTLMAILTTLRAVLKDITLEEQAHKIREALRGLGQEFMRFEERIDKLQKHYKNTIDDFEDVMITSKKIVKSFKDIDQMDEPPKALS